MITVKEIMPKELVALLVTNSCIDKHQAVFILNKHTAHCPSAHIVFVGWVYLRPNGFWHHAKHGPTIKFEIASVYRIDFHFQAFLKTKE